MPSENRRLFSEIHLTMQHIQLQMHMPFYDNHMKEYFQGTNLQPHTEMSADEGAPFMHPYERS